MAHRGWHPPFDRKRHEASGQYKIWRSMYMLRRFTYGELAATTGAMLDTVKSYVRRLQKAGYVRRHGKHHAPVWVLVRRTGPLAPALRRDGTVYDYNERKVFGQVELAAAGAKAPEEVVDG